MARHDGGTMVAGQGRGGWNWGRNSMVRVQGVETYGVMGDASMGEANEADLASWDATTETLMGWMDGLPLAMVDAILNGRLDRYRNGVVNEGV